MSSKRCLLFVSGGPAPTGAALAAVLAKEGVELSCVDTMCSTSASVGAAKYEVALSVSSSGHSRESFVQLSKVLAPGARVYVQDSAASKDALEALQKDLLLSGFAECELTTLSAVSLVVAKKPTWETGAKALLKKSGAAAAAPAPAAKKTWALSADDGDELMDDNELLTEEDVSRPAPVPASDCEVGPGKKACKNCSCGRAEMEAGAAPVKLTADQLENPTSACGNCSLGDAFRCAGCPYRGLPAFELGKKIELGSDFLVADA